jgi:hypothetical protein
MTTPDEAPPNEDRWRILAERVVRQVGGMPAVRTLLAVFMVYDRAGGGLVAAGLAYAALFALLPGMLLVLSILAILISDEATRERIVGLIADAVPPLEDIVRTAFEQVSAGAVPTGILAFIGLLWGASRFYAALDYAFTRIFHGSRQRNEIERTFRGVLLVSGGDGVDHAEDQPTRQQTYLRALQTLPNFEIILGHFLAHEISMPLASNPQKSVRVIKTEEKGSDVNIAAHLVHDGYRGLYDLAVLITNDSDLLEPVKVVRYELNLPIGILNPQQHPSRVLSQHASFFKKIRQGTLAASQFPSPLQDANGTFHKPDEW